MKILWFSWVAAPCVEAQRLQVALPCVGLQPVPADHLGPLTQLQLEDLGALLQHQVGAA